jgi:hypothetical protein
MKFKLPKFKSKKKKHEEFLIKEFQKGNVIRLDNVPETFEYSNKFKENKK